jgi:hypothetical protein
LSTPATPDSDATRARQRFVAAELSNDLTRLFERTSKVRFAR